MSALHEVNQSKELQMIVNPFILKLIAQHTGKKNDENKLAFQKETVCFNSSGLVLIETSLLNKLMHNIPTDKKMLELFKETRTVLNFVQS